MKKTLEPFQVVGAHNLANNRYHLLGDAPGLGKTVQAVAAIELINAKTALIICPASVRTHWRDEIEEGLGFVRGGFDIISYNAADSLSRAPVREKYDVCILDEAHFLKNLEAQRTRAVFGNERGLARRAGRVWALSGSPILNRPLEFYPLLRAMHPGFSQMSLSTYGQRYCGAHFNGRGIDMRGASNVEELRKLVWDSGFMTRRTKQEVYPGRRVPLVELIPLDVTPADLAPVFEEELAMANREAYLSPTHEKFAQLGDLARLLRLTGMAKTRSACTYLEDLLETVEKAVVFFHHTDVGRAVVERMAERGLGPVMYCGGMSDGAKDEAVEKFGREDGCRVFVGQIQSAGTGVDGLQSVCSEVVFVEQPWVPGVVGQAIDRLDRMGQAAECVAARILHAPGTLESAVLTTRERKGEIIDRLLGGSHGRTR